MDFLIIMKNFIYTLALLLLFIFLPIRAFATDFSLISFSFKIKMDKPGNDHNKWDFVKTSVNEIEKTLLLNYNMNNFLTLLITEEQEEKILHHPFRRAEIIFFGSMPLTVFLSWFIISFANWIVYFNSSFGTIFEFQRFFIYFGALNLSLFIAIDDFLISRGIKWKGIQITK